MGTKPRPGALFGMSSENVDLDDRWIKRLEQQKRRERQRAEAPVAMAEYRAAQQAATDRMHELRRVRLAREAKSKQRPSVRGDNRAD